MPQRPNRSFWLDIFKKSPLIASFMALSGIIGFGLGFYWFGQLIGPRGSLRFFLLMLASTTGGGIFIGLILGVLADSLWTLLRGDKPKRKPPRNRW